MKVTISAQSIEQTIVYSILDIVRGIHIYPGIKCLLLGSTFNAQHLIGHIVTFDHHWIIAYIVIAETTREILSQHQN